jgi:hypothetical protein
VFAEGTKCEICIYAYSADYSKARNGQEVVTKLDYVAGSTGVVSTGGSGSVVVGSGVDSAGEAQVTPSTPEVSVVDNADGSVTTTTTAADGTVTAVTVDGDKTVTLVTNTDGTKVETTQNSDDSTVVKQTAADGSAKKTTTLANGVSASVETNAKGAQTAISAQVPAAAAGAGTAVTLPISVEAAASTAVAPTISVNVEGASSTNVEIPVENATSGTIAVAVLPDGTEQIIKVAGTTDSGLLLNLEGATQIKIVDNSKTFADVPSGEWYADTVAFISSREIMNGMGGTGATSFAPNDTLNRAMMAQVLYNLDNANADSGAAAGVFADIEGDNWYNTAVGWASEAGYITGYAGGSFGPNDSVTREQVATILWRYAGSPEVSSDALQAFSDGESVNSYAVQAMAWAVDAGLIQGYAGSGALDPQGQATRAQIATIVARYCQAAVR